MEIEIYHVLNRGVDKRKIFLDDKDRVRFIHDLFEFNNIDNVLANNYYFIKNQSFDIGRQNIRKRKLLVNIHAFCLMDNHYHLLLSPIVDKGISLFMKKLNMGYAKYFNEKYDRVGALFQGKYKSIQVTTDAHFLYIPFYIHLNPLDLKFPEWRTRSIINVRSATKFLEEYRWSSHLDYLGRRNFPSVTGREFLLDFFGGEKGYVGKFKKVINDYSFDDVLGFTLE